MASKMEKIKCDQCEKVYYGKSNLERHILSVHLKIKFPCEICGIEYSQENNLNQHLILIHHHEKGKKKRVKCDQCDKSFATRGALHLHKQNSESHVLNVHEKIKYPCQLCWKLFHSESDLASHVSKPHPHLCNMCSKAFFTPSSLDYHVRKDHLQSYPCNLCGKILVYASALKNHMERVHKNLKRKEPKVNEQTQEVFELENESRQKKKLKKEVKDEPLELVIENVFTLNENVENETIIEKAHEENSKSEKPKVKEQMKETFKRCKEEPKKEVKNDPLELDIENVFPINENDEKETEESPIVFKKSKNEGEYVMEEYVMDENQEMLVKIDEMIDLTTLDDTTENENTEEVIDLTASDENEEL